MGLTPWWNEALRDHPAQPENSRALPKTTMNWLEIWDCNPETRGDGNVIEHLLTARHYTKLVSNLYYLKDFSYYAHFIGR